MIGTGDGFTDDGRLMACTSGSIYYFKPIDAINNTYTLEKVVSVEDGEETTPELEKSELPNQCVNVLEHYDKQYQKTANSLAGAMK